jgi:DNA-binding NarL/FixJ family response regulator
MMGGMVSPGTVALVSDDLMVAGDAVPDVAVLFVDLNTAVERRLALIGRLRGERPDLEIVGFSHHLEIELRRRARAAGANRVVNNGSIEAVALRRSGASAASPS